ncbi:alpha/beta fold hydrolase [Methylobacterium gossipiicola]|uniref:Pimeloyl-ACP methyl ester carboxylesterase n=1 Tax=Methylobacterium gossipiicola TaxID=582675 RepID=A0A1I2UIS8_9HYPH|nr:alpha/beta hydrolase [Methylobacterium gossipiicola]SFG76958.1 Pimeloyl-ACP methyl ester carboxylesterase [Methylobacterium gossipiicola]
MGLITSRQPALDLSADSAVPRRTVDLGEGRRLAYADVGDGPPLVLIHGTLLALEDMWIALGHSLAPHYRIIVVDRPGHGLSTRRRLVDASPWRQATLIHEALQALGVERPILVGHSFGGTVALCHGLLFPEHTAGLLALAPLCFPEIRVEQILFGPRFTPGLGEAVGSFLAETTDPALLPLLWRAIFLPQIMPETVAKEFPFALASGPERMIAEGEDALSVWTALSRAALSYGTCRVPVGILGGTADIVVNNALHGAVAARAIPQASFDWVPGAGHMLHHFHQDAVVDAIDRLAGRAR